MKVLSLWMLSTFLIEISIQQCSINDFKVVVRIFTNLTEQADAEINSIYYNCLTRSDTSDHYSSMSVSILYIRSDNPNNIHEVRYNLQCNNSVWEIVGNQSTALRNNNTRYCESCTDQNVNENHSTDYIGKHNGK